MRYKLMLSVLVFCASMAFAQDGILSGKVMGPDGEVVPGANVVLAGDAIVGGNTGTISDDEGAFRLEGLPAGDYRLRVTHIGFRPLVRDGVGIVAGGELELALALEAEVIFLDQNVVSASRRQEKILDAPASVSVVEAKDIRDRPALSIAEHIRDLPAVDFSQTGLAQANVVVRGFNNIFSGALLTLTDNRIARVPSLRLNSYNFIPVTNDDIERIEVVLGPGSALYGPNSSSGVMHIITQSPFNSAGTKVNFGIGERSVRKVGVRHAGQAGAKLGYKISAQYYSGNDWEFVDPVEQTARAANPALKARDFDLERKSAELRLDYKATEDLTAVFAAGYNDADNIELTGLGAGLARGWLSGYYQARLLWKDWFAQVYQNWSDAGDTFLLRNGGPIIDNSKLTAFQIQHAASLGVRQHFTYGADALFTRPDTEGSVNGGNEDDDEINEFGAYLQSETALTDMLDVVVALRYDEHNRTADAEISPRAALVFKPRETQTLRLTFNRAFSTPSSLNLYLDLRSTPDAFGTGAAFAPSLGFSPSIDVRAQGTYRKGFDQGWTFARSANGRPQYRSPFAPVAGLGTADYIDLDDPLFTNVMWGLGRGGVINQLTGLFEPLVAAQLQTQGLDQATAEATAAALTAQLPNLVPEQLAGLRNALLTLNTEKVTAGDPAPFDLTKGQDAFDVPLTRPTITSTYEFGYKGIIGKKLVVAADFYRTKTEDFVGPLQVSTPNVFLDPQALGAALGPEIGARFADPDNADIAAAVAVLDGIDLPGVVVGNGNGSAVDELTTLFAAGAASIPFGTITPEQAFDPTAVSLTYRNFGEVTINGIDLSLAYFPNEQLSLTGNYSYVDNTLFKNVDGIADVALNAPGNKAKLGGSYAFRDLPLALGAQFRYVGSFRQDSGVYAGEVDSYAALDLNLGYQLPLEHDLRLGVKVSNVLDNKYRTFVGAPEIGRLLFAQLSTSF